MVFFTLILIAQCDIFLEPIYFALERANGSIKI